MSFEVEKAGLSSDMSRVLLGEFVANLLKQLHRLLFGGRFGGSLFFGLLVFGKLGLGQQRLGHITELIDGYQNAESR